MSDLDGRPANGLHGLEEFESNGAAADADADFGDLEMFDSNASQLPFSSQVLQSIKPEEPVFPVPTGSAKRDKKKKAKGETRASDTAVETETPGSKRKKSKRKSLQGTDIPGGQVANGSLPELESAPTAPMGLNPSAAEIDDLTSEMQALETATVPSTQTRKKRKLSDSAEGKRRKKRKAHGEEAGDVVQGTQEETPGPVSRDAHAATFLRIAKSTGNGAIDTIDEDQVANPDETSPTVDRLRRRSPSGEARSREGSVPFRAAVAPMAIDGSPRDPDHQELVMETDNIGENQTNGLSLENPAGGFNGDHDVESLARQAWSEHVSSQAPNSDQLPETENGTNDILGSSANQEDASNSSPKRRRSTRVKKSKPTFFEQVPVAETPARKNRRALTELPSPSANTPKPRGRPKGATKKTKPVTPKREKFSQPIGSDIEEAEEEDDDYPRQSQSDSYTQGRFTDEELARISQIVESFGAEHGLTQFEVNELIHAPGGTTAGDIHAELWLRLAAQCPDRKRQKVINVTRKKFHNFVARGTWTPEQDAELSALTDVHGTAWSKIAAIINRHPEDVRDRYRNYIVCGANQRKDTWDEEEESRLTQHVQEAIETLDDLRRGEPNNQLLQRQNEELIDWQNISEKMERTRSRLQCITKWKAMQMRARGEKKPKSRSSKSKPRNSEPNMDEPELKPIESDEQAFSTLETARQQLASMHEEEQYRLVLAINATSVTADDKIPWSKLLDKKFRSQWSRAAQVLLWDRLKQTVPDWESKVVQEVAQYVINEYNRTGGMPEVIGAGYDDDERELGLLRQLGSRSTSNGVSSKKTPSKSAEFVQNSDVEEDGQTTQVANEETNIDPALVQEPPPSAQKPTPAKKATPKRPSAKRKSKKATLASQDPIEDGELVTPLPTVIEGEESSIDEEQFRKKKTPSKFKAVNNKNSENAAPVQPEPYSDSVMDDMEDLPPRTTNTA